MYNKYNVKEEPIQDIGSEKKLIATNLPSTAPSTQNEPSVSTSKNTAELTGWLSLSEAASHTPYSAEYLSLLARKNKLPSKKVGNVWYTTKDALESYMQRQMLRSQIQNGSLPVSTRVEDLHMEPLRSYKSDVSKYFPQVEKHEESTVHVEKALEKVLDKKLFNLFSAPKASQQNLNIPTVEAKAKTEAIVSKAPEKKVNVITKNSHFKTVFSSKVLVASALVAVIVFSIAPVPFVFSFFDKSVNYVMEAWKDANTVMGFRPGTHANEILLLDKEGNISIMGHIETEGQLRSYAPDGIAPIVVDSKTTVKNLSSDSVDGVSAEEFTLAFITKNGNVTTEDVVLNGDVSIGQTLLVKGATKLLNELEVGSDLKVFGKAEFMQALEVMGPAYFESLVTMAEGLKVKGNLDVGKNISVRGSIEALGAILGKSGSFGNLSSRGDLSVSGDATIDGDLEVSDIEASDIDASDISASSITAGTGTITNITLTNATSTNLYSVNAIFDNLAVGNQTLNGFNFVNATGTNATTTNFFSTNGNFTNLTADYQTITNLTFTNATGTNATTTNFFTSVLRSTLATITSLIADDITTGALTATNSTSTNATSTNLFSTNATLTNSTLTNSNITDLIFTRATGTSATTTNFFSTTASSTNLFSTNANIGNLTGGTGVMGTLLVNGSSTLQNFTFLNATGTSATTTNFFSTTASSTNLFSTNANIGNLTGGTGVMGTLLVNGSSTLQNFTFVNATGTNATTTNLYASNRVTTSIVSGLTALHTDSSNNLTVYRPDGTTHASVTAGGFQIVAGRAYSFANSQRIIDGPTNSNQITFARNPTFGVTFDFNTANTLTLREDDDGADIALRVGSFLASGSTTLQNFTFTNATGTSATTTNFFTSVFRSTLATITSLIADDITTGALTATNATITNSTTTNATTTNFYAGSGNFDELQAENQTITNLLFTNATGTNATTTNFFSTTASSTNLFSTNFNLGTGTIGSGTISNGTITDLLFTRATGTSATTTNFFSTTASSTNLFSSLLTVGGTGLVVDSSRNTTLGGNLTFAPDNTYDIGASGATRPRNLYIGTSIQLPSGSVTAPSLAGAQSSTGLYFGLDRTAFTAYGQQIGNIIRMDADRTMLSVTRPSNNAYQLTLDINSTASQVRGWNGNLSLSGDGGINFTTDQISRWNIGATSGHFLAATDNTYDIGASGATRPRTGYFGTSVISPLVTTPSLTTSSGAMTITPAAGSNLNVNLSTTGDFVVNTDDLYVDTSSGNVGIGTTTPSVRFSVGGIAGDTSGHGYFTGGLGVGLVNTTAGTIRTSGDVTIGGALTVNGALTSSITTGQIQLLATPTGTAINQGTVYINPTSAGTNNVLLGIAVNGTEKMRVDAEGDVQITGLFNSTGSGTNTFSGNLSVNGNTTLGTASTSSLTVNSSVASNFVPSADNTYNLGSSIRRWASFFATTASFDSISTSSSTESTFIINSDNATADTEDSSLQFERGTLTPNAIIKWDSTNDRFDFNDFPVRLQNKLIVSGTASSSFAGPLWLTGTSQGTGIRDSVLYVNPSSASANFKLFSIGVNDVSRFSVDAEGDTIINASLAIENTLSDITEGTLTIDDDLQINGNDIKDSGSVTRLTLGATNTLTGALTVTGTPFTLSAASAVLDFSSATGHKTISTGGTTNLALMPGGNVGINTTNPQGKLEIGSSGNLRFFSSTDSTADVSMGYISANSRNSGVDELTKIDFRKGSTYYSGEIAFSTAADMTVGALTEKMRIDKSGNVGIGTTTPVGKLQLANTSGAVYQYFSNNSTGHTASDGGVVGIDSSDNLLLGTYEAKRIDFYTNGLATPDVVIDSSGNMGVGTTTPGGRLNVQSSAASTYLLNLDYANGSDAGGIYESGSLGMSLLLKNTATTQTVQIATAGLSYFNGGNVGIGTTNPGTKFVVDQDSSGGTNYVAIGGSGASTGEMLKIYRNRESGFTDSPLVNIIQDSTGDDQTLFRLQQDSTGDIVNVFDGATEVFTILDGGNVGIGSATPQAALDVNGTVQFQNNTFNLTGTAPTVAATAGPILLNTTGTAFVNIDSNNNETDRAFIVAKDRTGQSGGTVLMQVNEDGNVGIGTTNPLSRLSVTKAIGSTTVGGGLGLRIETVNGLNTRSELGFSYADNIGTYTPVVLGYKNLENSAYTKGDFYIATRDATTDSAPTERLTVEAGGNVGIGTTNPTNILDVIGNSYISGGLGVADTNVTSGVVNVGTGFRIANAAASNNVLRGNGTNFVSSASAALTKTDDTNVTLTLGGTPATALLDAVSLTLGWTGQLSVPRGGTGAATFTTNGVLYGNATGAIQATAQGGTNTILTANNGAPAWSAAPTIGTSLTTPLIIGGAAADSSLELRSTSGTGTSDFIKFTVGTNGATEVMRVLNGGSVGIGLTNPNARFTIEKATSTTNVGEAVIARLQGANAVNARTEMGITYSGASGFYTPVTLGYQSTTHSGHTSGNFYIATRNATTDTAPTERFTILPSGNVGIGSTNPQGKLSVNVGTNLNAVVRASGGRTQIAGLNDAASAYASLDIDASALLLNASSGGNVGIGTTNPLTKLDIRGTSASADATLQIVGSGISTLLLGQDSRGGVIRGQGGSNELRFVVGGSGDTAAATGGTEAIRIISAGNVGIGTTNPGSKLEIAHGTGNQTSNAQTNSVSSATTISSPGTDYAALQLINTDQTNNNYSTLAFGDLAGVFSSAIHGYVSTHGAADQGGLAFTTRNGTSFAERMRLTPDGNVGIGTTDPLYKFDVQGTSNTVGIRALSNTTGDILYYGTGTVTGDLNFLQSAISATGSVNAHITNANTTAGDARVNAQVGGASAGDPFYGLTVNGVLNWSIGIDNSDSDKLKIGPTANPSSGTPSLTIDTSGNVGIGTTNPAYKLDVSGTGRFTGLVDAANFVATSTSVSSSFGYRVGILTSAPATALHIEQSSIYSNAIQSDTVFNGAATANNSSNLIGSDGYWAIRTATNNSYNLDVYNAGAQLAAMTVLQSGNVGIGTTTPQDRLAVIGSDSGELRLGGSNGRGQILGYSSGGALEWKLNADATGVNFGNTQAASLNLITNNTNRVTILSGGNVGIGTTNPDKTLSIRAATGSGLNISHAGVAHGMTAELPTDTYGYLRDINGNDGGLQLTGASDVVGTSGLQLRGLIGNSDPTDSVAAMVFEASKANGTGRQALGSLETAYQFKTGTTNLMTILGSGNVGIGTTNPGTNLHVKDTAGAAAVVAIDGAGGTAAWTRYDIGGVTKAYVGYRDTTAALSFYENGADQMVIKSGNVGIGTTTPTGKLHIYEGASGGTPYSFYDGLVVEDDTVSGISVLAPDAHSANLNFGSASQQFLAGLRAEYNGGSERLGFRLLDSEKMVILDSGNVGIGTTNPSSYKLQVSDGNIGIGGTGSTLAFYGPQAGVVGHTGAFDLNLQTNGVTRATITSGGNFGVGTTTPSAQFAVGGSMYVGNTGGIATSTIEGGLHVTNALKVGSSSLYLDTDSIENLSGNLLINASTNKIGIGTTTPTSVLSVHAGATATYNASLLTVASSTAAYATSTHFTILAGGNVGIGTANPALKTEINTGTLTNTYNGIKLTDGTVNAYNLILANSSVWGEATTGFALGTGSNHPMAFATNGIERMRILSSGNVGIGTTTPLAQLHVANGVTTARIGIGPNDTAGNPIFRLGFVDAATDYAEVQSLNGTSLALNPAGNNVGVGTTSPSSNLHVYESVNGDADLYVTNPSTGTAGRAIILLGESGSGGNYGYLSHNSSGYTPSGVHTPNTTVLTGQDTGGLTLSAGAAAPLVLATNATERMRILSGGNVGIGTTDPTSLLTINNATAGTFRIQQGDANDRVDIEVSDTNTNIQAVGNDLNIWDNTAARLTVEQGGNIGIGTTNPGYKLDVSGSINAGSTGGYYINSSVFANRVSNYNVLYEPEGNIAIHMGNSTDAGNYYNNTAHYLRSRNGNSNYASFGSSGTTLYNNLYFSSNYGHGVVGLYDSTKYQNVYSMGDAYKPSADGTSITGMYGLSWTHTNVGGQSKSGLAHQLLIVNNGTTQTALGTGIWTNGVITTTSNSGIVINGSQLAGNSGLSYGSLALTTANNSYYGLNFGGNTTNATLMFDSSGNGGHYNQAAGAWGYYWNESNNSLGVGGSTTHSSYPLYVTGNAYVNGGMHGSGNINFNATGNVLGTTGATNKVLTVDHGSFSSSNVLMQINTASAASSANHFLQMTSSNNSDNEFLFRADGVGLSDGGWTGAADVAEWTRVVGTPDAYEPGDLVTFARTTERRVVKADEEDQELLMGVVTLKPGLTGVSYDIADDVTDGVSGSREEMEERYNAKMIATIGYTPVKVSTENGPLMPGDGITISSTTGVGRKANPGEKIVGYAFENFDPENGLMGTHNVDLPTADQTPFRPITRSVTLSDGTSGYQGWVFTFVQLGVEPYPTNLAEGDNGFIAGSFASSTASSTITQITTVTLDAINGALADIFGLMSEMYAAITEIKDTMLAWADRFVSRELVATEKICIGETCINESQLAQLLQNSGMTASAMTSSGSTGSTSTTTSSTATSTDSTADTNGGNGSEGEVTGGTSTSTPTTTEPTPEPTPEPAPETVTEPTSSEPAPAPEETTTTTEPETAG